MTKLIPFSVWRLWDLCAGLGVGDFARGQRGRETPEAKYKIREAVLVASKFGTFVGEVDGSNLVDTDEIEYAVKGFPFLLWEDELRRVE